MDEPRIGIIGGGLAGISSCAALLRSGHPSSSIVLFEASSHLGGKWAPGGSYPGTVSNTPGRLHALWGQPIPTKAELDEGWKMPADQFRKNVVVYAKEHGVTECVKLGAKVVSISKDRGAARQKWIVKYKAGEGAGAVTERFDKIVLCEGPFTHASMPVFAQTHRWAPSSPSSRILHSFDLSSPSLFSTLSSLSSSTNPSTPGHIIVIGAFQSAVDLACKFGQAGRQVTLMMSNPGTYVPQAGQKGFPNGDADMLGALTRVGGLWTPFYRETVGFRAWTSPLAWAQWFWHSTWLGRRMLLKRLDGFVGFLKWFYGWSPSPSCSSEGSENPLGALESDTPLLWGFGKVCVLPVGLKELIVDGKVKIVRGSATGIERPSKDGPYVLHYRPTGPSASAPSAALEADAIVFATGAAQSASRLFSSEDAAELGLGMFASDDREAIVKREGPFRRYDEDELRRLVKSVPLFAHPPEGVKRPMTNEEVEVSISDSVDPSARIVAPLRLFRGIVPIASATDRDFAVVGQGLISFGGTLATQMQAEWVADWFEGKIEVPREEEMKRDAAARAVWARRVLGPASFNGTYVGAHCMTYVDSLARDMGVSAPPFFDWRRPKAYFTDVPFPAAYSAIWEQKRRRRNVASVAGVPA